MASYETTVEYAEKFMRENFSAMKREYTRMRDIAQKRVSRLGKAFPESKAYQYHKYGFAKLRDLNKADMAKAFSELSKFVHAKASTVAGQKDIQMKTISTLRKQGLNVNKGNYANLISIFERMRKNKLVYGSDKAVSLAEAMTHVDKSTQEKWLNNLEHMLPIADELVTMPDDEGDEFDDLDFWDDDE